MEPPRQEEPSGSSLPVGTVTIFDRKVALERLPERYTIYQLGRAWLHAQPDRLEPSSLATEDPEECRRLPPLPPLPPLTEEELQARMPIKLPLQPKGLQRYLRMEGAIIPRHLTDDGEVVAFEMDAQGDEPELPAEEDDDVEDEEEDDVEDEAAPAPAAPEDGAGGGDEEDEGDGVTDATPRGFKIPIRRTQTVCGTFGCILPNNHSGLHQMEEGMDGGRSAKRVSRRPAESPAAERDALAEPEAVRENKAEDKHATSDGLRATDGAEATAMEVEAIGQGNGSAATAESPSAVKADDDAPPVATDGSEEDASAPAAKRQRVASGPANGASDDGAATTATDLPAATATTAMDGPSNGVVKVEEEQGGGEEEGEDEQDGGGDAEAEAASSAKYGRGARVRRAPTWSREAPEEQHKKKRWSGTNGVPQGKRKVAGASLWQSFSTAPEKMLAAHVTHWRRIKAHEQLQHVGKLNRHRERLRALFHAGSSSSSR